MSEYSEVFEQARINGYVGHFNHVLSQYYELPQLLGREEAVVIGRENEECLERVTDRKNFVEIVEGGYVLNANDCALFSEELEYVLVEDQFNEDIGTMLFIGLGVAGDVAFEALSKVRQDINPLKAKPHYEALEQFFESPRDVQEVFQTLFIDLLEPDEDGGVKLGMTERLNSASGAERVDAINGLRLRLHLLLAVPEVKDTIGINNRTLVTAAQKQIRDIYDRDIEDYRKYVKRFGQNEKGADKMFFDNLPDWLIAAATPIRDQQLVPIFSKAWNY